MRSSISSLTTITTSQKLMPSSDTYIEKIARSMMRLTRLTQRLQRSWSVMMSSLSHLFHVFTVWVRRRNTLIAWWACVQVWRFLVINFSMTWWISSLSAMTSTFNGEIPCPWDVVEFSQLRVMSMPFELSFRDDWADSWDCSFDGSSPWWSGPLGYFPSHSPPPQ